MTADQGMNTRRPELIVSKFLKSTFWVLLVTLVVCSVTTTGLAQDNADGGASVAAVSEAAPRADIPGIWYCAPVFAIVALLFARKFYSEVMAADEGDESMIKIASYVREGAMAYLNRQYKVVAVVFVVRAGIRAFT